MMEAQTEKQEMEMIGYVPRHLEIGYAYPTSKHAADCGASETGGYIVKRTLNIKTGKRLASPVLAIRKAFATEAEAEAWARSWAE